jgi:membrane associated rhomboid family serine protease
MKQKILFSLMLCLWYITGWRIGVTPSSNIVTHILYIPSHVNIFHLLCNLFWLWSFKNKVEYLPALCIAFVASFLPNLVTAPTYGCSGFLFAACGIMWGKAKRFKDMCKYCLPAIVLTALFPNINFLIHLYCLMIGFLYAITICTYRRKK